MVLSPLGPKVTNTKKQWLLIAIGAGVFFLVVVVIAIVAVIMKKRRLVIISFEVRERNP